MSIKQPRILSRLANSGLVVAGIASVTTPACLSRPLEGVKPKTTSTVTQTFPRTRVDKIDILLAIDDSRSMGDKQDLLAEAIPNLVSELINPPCIDDSGAIVERPDSSLVECPLGSAREFEPVVDVHIGVISSSLGSPTEDECKDANAQLLKTVPTFEESGFLVWQPEQTATRGRFNSGAELQGALTDMVAGVGETGCGHEAQLESMYRFLIDPDVSQQFAERRNAFLRPDSMVAIVMLSDENDCSFKPGKHDPAAMSGPEQDAYNRNPNTYCFNQKQRYGADMLYPVQRYVDGLTKITIENADGETVLNPLFVRDGQVTRSTDHVFMAGIVGVPWQLVARDHDDLRAGFMTPAEMNDAGTWDVIVGDPDNGVLPSDAHMIESIEPRPGLPSETSSDPYADPYNGHEHGVANANSTVDLQYACIFDLPQSFPCSSGGACDCSASDSPNSPLCQDEQGQYGSQQYRAKAYPSTRQLSVLEGIGDQAIVGSICPSHMDDTGRADYGYKPTIEALIAELKAKLKGACLNRSFTADESGQVSCLVLEGRRVEDGETCDCSGAARTDVEPLHQEAMNEAMSQPTSRAKGLNCFCEIGQLSGQQLDECQESTDEAPTVDGQSVDGWCYIDAEAFPQTGNEALVSHCKVTERRTIRFVGQGEPANHAMTFITCHE